MYALQWGYLNTKHIKYITECFGLATRRTALLKGLVCN